SRHHQWTGRAFRRASWTRRSLTAADSFLILELPSIAPPIFAVGSIPPEPPDQFDNRKPRASSGYRGCVSRNHLRDRTPVCERSRIRVELAQRLHPRNELTVFQETPRHSSHPVRSDRNPP